MGKMALISELITNRQHGNIDAVMQTAGIQCAEWFNGAVEEGGAVVVSYGRRECWAKTPPSSAIPCLAQVHNEETEEAGRWD